MTAVGFSLFGGVYVLSSLIGVIVYDTSDDNRLRNYGRDMLVPVAGPWMALRHTGSATGAWATGFVGVVQAAGLAVGTVGAIRLARRNRHERRLSFSSTPLPGGGQMGATLRF